MWRVRDRFGGSAAVTYCRQRLREGFDSIDNPAWDSADAMHPLSVRSRQYEVLRKITNPEEKIV
jgi:hypothetical protein